MTGWKGRLLALSVLLTMAPMARPGTSYGAQSVGLECGVYAMAAAARSLGAEVDRSLIASGEFVGPRGSSARQLADLASRINLWARPVQGVSVEFLRCAPHPVILNLKLDSALAQSGHWVAFLGDEDGAAIVFDSVSPEGCRRTSYGELSLLMNGEAVLVAADRPAWWTATAHLFGSVWATWCWLIAAGVVWWLAALTKPCQRFNCLSCRLLVLVSLGLISGLSAWWLSATGPGRNRSAVAWVHSRHCTDDFPEVHFRQFEAMLGESHVAIVDARPDWMFRQDHIPGAVNFPVNARPDDLAPFVESLAGKQAVFVYCSTPTCQWGRVVAGRLKAAGVRDVRVFEEGMEGYAGRIRKASRTDREAP